MSQATMLAGVLLGKQKIALQQKPIPEPGPLEVRIKMEMLGICGSDVSLFQGHRANTPYPLIIGHEGIGKVDKVGVQVKDLMPGQRVVIEPNFPCGHCEMCWSGRGNICLNKRIFGVLEPGCFAEYAVVPAQFAWPLADFIAPEDAVLIEPLAVALHALYTSPSRPGDTLAVVGLGAIGLLLVQLACRMGYQVLAHDKVPEKMALAATFGAIPYPNHSTNELAALWHNTGVNSIFECAGVAIALTNAIKAAPRGATIVVVGLADQPSELNEFTVTRQGIQILSSIIYQHPLDFRRSIQLLEHQFILPHKIISAHHSFQELPQALEAASKGEHSKIVLRF